MLTRRRFLALGAAVVASTAAGLGAAELLPGPRPRPDLFDALPGPAPAATPAGPPAPPPTPAAGPPITVALLSDTHIQQTASPAAPLVNPKLKSALADLQTLRPDLWVTNGDVSENGISAEFGAFKEITGPAVPPDRLLVTTGNHEFYDMKVGDEVSISRFREAFSLVRPYNNRLIGGVHLVLLADEQWKGAPHHKDWAWLSPQQLSWFEQVLAAQKETFTAVFLHQPLQETVANTFGANPFGGSGQAKELRAILTRNPQIRLWFSGHTHRRLEAESQVSPQGATTFVALGSTAYLLGAQPGSGAPSGKDYTASQSRVMEIWPDRVVVRARDHTARTWMDRLEVTIKRT